MNESIAENICGFLAIECVLVESNEIGISMDIDIKESLVSVEKEVPQGSKG